MIFPESANTAVLSNTIQSTNTTLPLAKEYAWDFENNDFFLIDGKFQKVKGKDAVKVWVMKAMLTQRYRYQAYSWNFGHELEDLIGKGLSQGALTSEVERCIKEALLINPYITSITNLDLEISDNKITASFTVNTIYGEVNISV
jgi:hypothetical protein